MRARRVLTLGRTEVLVHPAVIAFLGYALLAGQGLLWCVAMLSILLHEGAHAAAAALWGQTPRTVEITPLGAVMRLDDEQRLPPLRRLTMLAAGPMMTLLLCGAAILLTQRGILPVEAGRICFLGNLAILGMNLLPALPLDGGRMLALLLGCVLPQRTTWRVMRILGNVLGGGLVLLNLYACWRYGGWNLSLAFGGCCLIYSAAASTTTRAMAELRFFLDRKICLERKGSLPAALVMGLHTQTLHQLLQRLHPRRMTVYTILEAGSQRILGTVTEFDVVQGYLAHPDQTCGIWLKAAKSGKK